MKNKEEVQYNQKAADVGSIISAVLYTSLLTLSQFFTWGVYPLLAMLGVFNILMIMSAGASLAGYTHESKYTYRRAIHFMILCIIAASTYQLYLLDYVFFAGITAGIVSIAFFRNIFHKGEEE